MTLPMLGKRPPSGKPALMLATFLPTSPEIFIPDSYIAPSQTWPMDENDRFGVCVVAAIDHALQDIANSLGLPRKNWTQAQIFEYYKTQNPDFDPATGAGDNGMDIQTFLAYLAKQGVITAFAKVNHNDLAAVRAAGFVFIALVTGQVLQIAQQKGMVWGYVSGSPDWGGHATATIGANPGAGTCVSWGELYQYTAGFEQHCVDEQWVILTPELIAHPDFRAGVDMVGFAAEFTALTGRPFPLPVQPPDADATLKAALGTTQAQAWLKHSHTGAPKAIATALKAWLGAKP